MRCFLYTLCAVLGSMTLAACSGGASETPEVYRTQAEATLMITPPTYMFQPNLVVTFSCPKDGAKPFVKVQILGKQPKDYRWQRAIKINQPQALDGGCVTLYSVNKPRVPWIGSYHVHFKHVHFYAADSEGRTNSLGRPIYDPYGVISVDPAEDSRDWVLLLQTNELPPGPVNLVVSGDEAGGGSMHEALYPYLPPSLRN